jgi:hypothetical protein
MNDNFELKLSFSVVFFLVLVYIGYEIVTTPSGGHPFGHGLGILGALLMVMTETLYSLRKRLGWFSFWPVRHWLSFHIFTGIVGPTLVFMHTALEFRGLAGFTFLMTILVVLSGFLGRYIYTAVPRSLAGVELDRRTLEQELWQARQELMAWSADKSMQVQILVSREAAATPSPADLSALELLGRRWQEGRERRRIRQAIRQLDRQEQARMGEIEKQLRRQQRLIRQIRSLQTVRRLMGYWHTFHIPLGLTLFTAMFIHIGATIYYGVFS